MSYIFKSNMEVKVVYFMNFSFILMFLISGFGIFYIPAYLIAFPVIFNFNLFFVAFFKEVYKTCGILSEIVNQSDKK